jgi:SAM-dependent methyltransferase
VNETAQIYDRLLAFESSHKPSSYPVHKQLKGKSLLEHIENTTTFNDDDTILDAGCGNGFVLFQLHKKYGISGTGISISPKEIERAHEQNRNPDHLTFKLQSYDHPLDKEYSKMLAIESLKHSENLNHTVKILSKAVASGGHLVIADDFILKDTPLLDQHKLLWNVSSMCHANDLIEKLVANDFEMVKQIDLSHSVPIKNHLILSLLIFITRIVSFTSRKTNIGTYLGALLLEKCYHLKLVSYLLIVAKKI